MKKNNKAKKISLSSPSGPSRRRLLDRIVTYIEEKSLLWMILGVMVVVGVGTFTVWRNYRDKRELAAQEAIWPAETHLRDHLYDLALEGGMGDMGLLEVIEEYVDTKAGNLANFYIGVIYLERKEYEKAISYLEAFDGKGTFMQPRVWSLLGDIYCDLKNYDKALSYYLEAANDMRNEFTTPGYLIKAALLYEELGQVEKALACYEDVCKSFPLCEEYLTAVKHASRLKVLREGS